MYSNKLSPFVTYEQWVVIKSIIRFLWASQRHKWTGLSYWFIYMFFGPIGLKFQHSRLYMYTYIGKGKRHNWIEDKKGDSLFVVVLSSTSPSSSRHHNHVQQFLIHIFLHLRDDVPQGLFLFSFHPIPCHVVIFFGPRNFRSPDARHAMTCLKAERQEKKNKMVRWMSEEREEGRRNPPWERK